MQRTAIIGFGCAGFHAAAKSMRSMATTAKYIYTEYPTPLPANPMLTTYYVTGTLAYGGCSLRRSDTPAGGVRSHSPLGRAGDRPGRRTAAAHFLRDG